jgi:hypothetical protein
MEDLDLESERDAEDDIVSDVGFAARTSWAMAQLKHRKPSDEVANGDEKEDLEVENERDVNDDIVQDVGFAPRMSWAMAQRRARQFKQSRKPSDEVANGDEKEDLEVENERDVNDDIVQDVGFAPRMSWAMAQKRARHPRNNEYLQIKVLPSDEVANGDEKEDLEVEDERDQEDYVVQDVGFAARSSWVQLDQQLNY